MSTRAEKLAEARRKKAEEERLAAERKEAEVEDRKRFVRERQLKVKKQAEEARKDYEEFDGKIFCNFCGDLVEKPLYDEHKLTHPAEIRHRLWLGSAEHATSPEVLARVGVTHVLNCTHEIECPKHISKLLIGFKRVKLADRVADSIMEHIKEALTWVDEALSNKSHTLLIHCREGKSRSTSFLTAFLMWKSEISFPAALGMCRARRSVAMPNPKFFGQLEALDKVLQTERSPEAALKAAERQYPPSTFRYKLMPYTGELKDVAASVLTAPPPPDDSDSKTPEVAKKKKKGAAADGGEATAGKKKRDSRKVKKRDSRKLKSAAAGDAPAKKKKMAGASKKVAASSKTTAAKKKKKAAAR